MTSAGLGFLGGSAVILFVQALSPAAPLPEPQPLVRADAPDLLTRQAVLRRSALSVALFALAPWATLGFPLLSAVVLLQKGYKVDQSLVFAALSMVGPPLGALLAGRVIDRLERSSSCRPWRPEVPAACSP